MILFQNEEEFERGELISQDQSALMGSLITAGIEKSKEPLHRTKKLRGWPSEAIRKGIYLETMVRETGHPPERPALEAWRKKEAEALWITLTKNIPEKWVNTILREHALCHIAKVISNTIHLEKMYTTLKPIGERQWQESSKTLKSLADDTALMSLTEKSKREGKIPDWIKGAILYLSLVSSKKVGQMLHRGPSNDIPDMSALKSAADWCLGTHLNVGGEAQSLEETTKLFEGWQIKRAKIELKIVQLEVENIPVESEVPPPEDNENKSLEWNLTWRILPIMEKEIRELGERVLINEAALVALGESYKIKTLDRWANAVAQRSYIRAFEATQNVGERWKTRTLVLNPIDAYASSRIKGKTPLTLTAKTELAWLLGTEDLPEPDLA